MKPLFAQNIELCMELDGNHLQYVVTLNTKKRKKHQTLEPLLYLLYWKSGSFLAVQLKLFVPLGSKWCDTCRKKTHYNLCQKNSAVIKTLTFCNCSACCSIHDTLGNLQNHLSETLAKKQKNDLENGNADDEDFREEGSEQHSFNESMIEINTKWTPRKYQLRTDLNAVSVKTKEKLVRKSNQAVKSILEIIAPGQSETLREACLEETELTSDSSLYILKIM